MRILLISDIHGNYPALQAISKRMPPAGFDAVLNSGDITVYCPFPNETIEWLTDNKVLSIRGNTDDKVIKLLKGKTFTKPRKAEKRIMYTTTAEALTEENKAYLLGLKKRLLFDAQGVPVELFHGSPADHNEFLFPDTPVGRFRELAAGVKGRVVLTGHSHTPYHIRVDGVDFINPGSVGRMFDGTPHASFAVLTLEQGEVRVAFHRVPYDIDMVVKRIRSLGLPDIYIKMYKAGRKLN